MKPIVLHAVKTVAWGLLSVAMWYVIVQINVIQVMGRHRFRLQGLEILDWIQSVLTLPCLWIRPGSIFDGWLPSLTIMALFWGLFIHGTGIVIKDASRRCRRKPVSGA
jgi:hypothetical protein